MRKFILFAALAVFSAGCRQGEGEDLLPEKPDYKQEDMWYRGPGASSGKDADVFYVTPTCVWEWEDSLGNTIYYMDVENQQQRASVDASNFLAYSLFNKSCNFYSPYYRQITMGAWFKTDEEIEKLYAVSHQDVTDAFDYYMENLNQGRPFILAGHSQGAKAIIRLLEERLTDEQYSRLVAAYAFGFEISREELDRYRHLKPAEGPDDCGVIICYNSVSSTEAISPAFKDNVVCINPINWKTDSTYAPASENAGSVFFHSNGQSDTLFNAVGAKLLPEEHVLLIDGLDDEDYFVPSIGRIFPKGNYHVQEINLYFLNLQKNIEERISSYLKEKSSSNQ